MTCILDNANHPVFQHEWTRRPRGVTTVPGSNPGCITSHRDWESHRAARDWPCVARVGRHYKQEFVLKLTQLNNNTNVLQWSSDKLVREHTLVDKRQHCSKNDSFTLCCVVVHILFQHLHVNRTRSQNNSERLALLIIQNIF